MNKLSSNRTLYICLLLAIVTFAIYAQLLRCPFIEFDDNLYVKENPNIHSGLTLQNIKWAFTTTHSANWHPLTWLSHMLDCQIFGLNPAGHHLTNILLHTLNTILLFLVLNAMTHALWRSAFVAAAFALHPLHVESVAWIAERKDVLSTFFWMLTLAAYYRYTQRPAVSSYLLALVLFVLGLMAKPMLVTLPFVLLLLNYWPLNRIDIKNIRELIRLTIEKLPFFILSAVSSIITLIVQQKGGAVVEITTLPAKSRMANALVSYLRYIEKTVWPAKLSIFYPFKHPHTSQVVPAIIVLFIISIIVIYFARNRKYLLTGWLWYLGTLVPVIGLVQVGQQAFADRYTYIPSIGLFIIASWTVFDLSQKIPHRRIILAAISIAVISTLSVLTYIQAGYWRDSVTLFQHAIDVTKNNARMYHNLGLAYGHLEQYPQAIEAFRKSIRIDPHDPESYQNLALAYSKSGRYAESFEASRQAIALEPNSPHIYYNLGKALGQSGRDSEAISAFQKAVELKPDFAKAYSDLGIAYINTQQYPKAIEALTKALSLAPNTPEDLCNLGIAYYLAGDKNSALKQYQILTKLDPNWADKLLKQIKD